VIIASFADLHARGLDLGDFAAQWTAALNVCAARHVDLILIAGDVFDRSNIGGGGASTGAVARAVIGPLDSLRHCLKRVIAIPGNHDQAGIGSVDALTVLEAMPTVQIARWPQWIQRGEVAVCCVPWSWSGENAEAAIRAAMKEKPGGSAKSILLAHLQVGGAKMSATQTAKGADTWSVSRVFLESLPFDRVVLGDFHPRQDLTGGRGGYVGALRQLDHGEEGNPAGFEIWNSETNRVEWVELDAAPRYRTVEIEHGQPIPKAGPNEILRVRTLGFVPTRAEAMAAGANNGHAIKIEPVLERVERISRADDVPIGALNDPSALLAIWTEKNQIGDADVARLKTLLAEVVE
jgi:hypothetical protein